MFRVVVSSCRIFLLLFYPLLCPFVHFYIHVSIGPQGYSQIFEFGDVWYTTKAHKPRLCFRLDCDLLFKKNIRVRAISVSPTIQCSDMSHLVQFRGHYNIISAILFFLWFSFCSGESGLVVTPLYTAGYFCNFVQWPLLLSMFSSVNIFASTELHR